MFVTSTGGLRKDAVNVAKKAGKSTYVVHLSSCIYLQSLTPTWEEYTFYLWTLLTNNHATNIHKQWLQTTPIPHKARRSFLPTPSQNYKSTTSAFKQKSATANLAPSCRIAVFSWGPATWRRLNSFVYNHFRNFGYFFLVGTFDRVPNPHLTSTKAPKYFNRSKGTAPPRAMTRSLSDRLRLMWQAPWYIAAKTAIVVCVCVVLGFNKRTCMGLWKAYKSPYKHAT